jgi:hypothetical protein
MEEEVMGGVRVLSLIKIEDILGWGETGDEDSRVLLINTFRDPWHMMNNDFDEEIPYN